VFIWVIILKLLAVFYLVVSIFVITCMLDYCLDNKTNPFRILQQRIKTIAKLGEVIMYLLALPMFFIVFIVYYLTKPFYKGGSESEYRKERW